MLEHAEERLKWEQVERQTMVAKYTKLLANSEASKKKHDSAVEEYHKYQLGQMQARIKQLEEEAAEATDSDSESGEESVEDPQQLIIPVGKGQEPQDVVELDSDDE